MYRKLLIGAMFVVAVPMLSLADGPDSGAIPPDYGPYSRPPAPLAGEAASGWIFLSHPDHFKTPLYHLHGEGKDGPAVTILVSRKGSLSALRTFDLAPRLMLNIVGSAADEYVSVASGDIVPVSGRLVKFERAKFPADYPKASIPKNVTDRGLRWTDVTDSVPAEVRPGKGWPLVLGTADSEKPSGYYRFHYKLFPDLNLRTPEIHKRPFYVRVAGITAKATEDGKSHAEIEIIEKTQLQRKTVGRMSVQVGQFIQHDKRAHRVLKIVPPQKIKGIGNLIGWVEVELSTAGEEYRGGSSPTAEP